MKSYPRPIAVTVSPLTQFVKSAVACVAPVNVHLKEKIVLIQLLQGLFLTLSIRNGIKLKFGFKVIF